MNIKNKIFNELVDLGLPLNGVPFVYWNELLYTEYKNEFNTPNIVEKYYYLAEKHNINKAAVERAVERALRRGKDSMKNRIKEKYNIKTKITNESIVLLFKFNIF